MARRALLYYDGDCNLCNASARCVARLDVWRRLELRGGLDDEARSRGITNVDLGEAMYLVFPNGGTLSAFRALRRVLLQLPVAWLLVPLVWAPGAAFVGSRLYRWLARRRKTLCGPAGNPPRF